MRVNDFPLDHQFVHGSYVGIIRFRFTGSSDTIQNSQRRISSPGG